MTGKFNLLPSGRLVADRRFYNPHTHAPRINFCPVMCALNIAVWHVDDEKGGECVNMQICEGHSQDFRKDGGGGLPALATPLCVNMQG